MSELGGAPYCFVSGYRVLPGSPWFKGVVWGLILWLLAQVMVLPMMGMGFFPAHAPQA